MAVRLPPFERWTSLAIVGAVALALVLLALAIARYPGGNDIDRQAPGFDPVRNYLSDLLHAHALAGPENAAAPFARAAMLALVAGLPPLFLALSRLVARPALAAFVLVAGLASSVGWVAVPLTSSDAFGRWHGAFILLAVVPGLAASIVAMISLARARPRLALLGAATLAAIALTVGLYVPLLTGAKQVSIAVPVLQKVCGALLVAWMLATAAAAPTGAEAGASGSRTPAAP